MAESVERSVNEPNTVSFFSFDGAGVGVVGGGAPSSTSRLAVAVASPCSNDCVSLASRLSLRLRCASIMCGAVSAKKKKPTVKAMKPMSEHAIHGRQYGNLTKNSRSAPPSSNHVG